MKAKLQEKRAGLDKTKQKWAKKFTERIEGPPREVHALPTGKYKIPKWAVDPAWRQAHPDQQNAMTGESSADDAEASEAPLLENRRKTSTSSFSSDSDTSDTSSTDDSQ